jgi:hypothetical protein
MITRNLIANHSMYVVSCSLSVVCCMLLKNRICPLPAVHCALCSAMPYAPFSEFHILLHALSLCNLFRIPSGAQAPMAPTGRRPHSPFRLLPSAFHLPNSFPFRIPTSHFRLLLPSAFRIPTSHFITFPASSPAAAYCGSWPPQSLRPPAPWQRRVHRRLRWPTTHLRPPNPSEHP